MKTVLEAAMLDHEFSYLLMQLPKPASASSKPVAEKPDADMNHAVAVAVAAKLAKLELKGRGKGKDKPSAEGVIKTKKGSKKNVTRTKAGKPLCFAYQKASGCDKAKDGEACPRGLHLCCIRDCEAPHPGCRHGR